MLCRRFFGKKYFLSGGHSPRPSHSLGLPSFLRARPFIQNTQLRAPALRWALAGAPPRTRQVRPHGAAFQRWESRHRERLWSGPAPLLAQSAAAWPLGPKFMFLQRFRVSPNPASGECLLGSRRGSPCPGHGQVRSPSHLLPSSCTQRGERLPDPRARGPGF